jgi:hypothetical protein
MPLDTLAKFLPFLIPIVIIEIGLAIFAAIHVWNHPHYKFFNRTIWMVIVIVFQIIGPIFYFTLGRAND